MDGVSDIVSFGPDRPWRPPRWLLIAGLVALSGIVLASIALLATRDPDGRRPASLPAATPAVPSTASAPPPPAGEPRGPACVPVGLAQSPRPPGSVSGLRIGAVPAVPGAGLDRCDRTAVDGPWTVVVRRPGGSLGRQGAVVTFPVEPRRAGRGVAVDGRRGTAEPGMVTWPLAGEHARIRGDLSEAELVAIAARTTVADGRPAVDPPAGFAVVTSGPYRPPAVHELRYASGAVGERATLGDGMAYTGVTSGGGFEDQLYAVPTTDGGPVHGRPSVVSSVSGGNATLAWEPAPGLVAYVGYSGRQSDAGTAAALHRLAGRTRVLSHAEWRAAGPATVDQPNEPG
jgi:hypothetical protein